MTDENDLVTVLVIKHPTQNMSVEGAIYQRNEADKAIAALGLEVVAATTGRGDAASEGLRIMKLTWGVKDA